MLNAHKSLISLEEGTHTHTRSHLFTNADRCDRLCFNGDMRDVHYYQWAWWSYCFQDVTFPESLTKLHCICYFPNALQTMFGDSILWLEYWMCYWLNWWLTRLVQCWFHPFISGNDQPRCFTTQLSSLMTSWDCLYCIPAVMCYSHCVFACVCVFVCCVWVLQSGLIHLCGAEMAFYWPWPLMKYCYQLYMSRHKTLEWHIMTTFLLNMQIGPHTLAQRAHELIKCSPFLSNAV